MAYSNSVHNNLDSFLAEVLILPLNSFPSSVDINIIAKVFQSSTFTDIVVPLSLSTTVLLSSDKQRTV
jgi:hypothetical protein